jgi:nucleoside-diphosphate-sugar epimerase
VIEELIRSGHEPVAVSRSTPEQKGRIFHAACDLDDSVQTERLFSKLRPDATVHLAWEGLPDYSPGVSEKNERIGLNVYKAALNAGSRMIITSGSCLEYAGLSGAVNEDSHLDDDNPFPGAKNRLRIRGTMMAGNAGASFYWLRFFYVYGPGQRPGSLIPHVIRTMADGKIPEIRTPWAVNDFIHVADAARAVCAVLDTGPLRGEYNVGSGEPKIVGDIVNRVAQLMGRPQLSIFWDKGSQRETYHADITRIIRETGWRPRVSIDDGIRETLRFIRDFS